VHALAVDGLTDPSLTVLAARRDGRLVGIGALRDLGGRHAEIKSMHVAATERGRGVGRAILGRLVALAEVRGGERVSLETGTMPAFEPARSLYLSAGFVECESFGDYLANPNSVCMTRRISPFAQRPDHDEIEIRRAAVADLPAITEIMNALLPTTTYEWTEAPHTIEERRAWLNQHSATGDPVLVADWRGETVGWASYGDFRDTLRWPGYWPTVEHSVHVRQGRWSRGVGRALLSALTEHALLAGRRVMVAAIDRTNERSIAFHERLGFAVVGRLPGTGDKFDRELDLILMQRRLAP
jgi:L-amino acid N-acyltransferase YncA